MRVTTTIDGLLAENWYISVRLDVALRTPKFVGPRYLYYKKVGVRI